MWDRSFSLKAPKEVFDDFVVLGNFEADLGTPMKSYRRAVILNRTHRHAPIIEQVVYEPSQ